jgi:hypothetical protein
MTATTSTGRKFGGGESCTKKSVPTNESEGSNEFDNKSLGASTGRDLNLFGPDSCSNGSQHFYRSETEPASEGGASR